MNKPVRDGPAAQYVQDKLKSLGIHDVEMYWDQQIGMWAVCQVYRPSGKIMLLRGTQLPEQKPQIMWWVKDNEGRYRVPSDRDIHDVIVTVQRAQKIWEKGGDWLADKFDEQDKKRDDAHRQKLKDTVHDIAPAMKKAIQKGKF